MLFTMMMAVPFSTGFGVLDSCLSKVAKGDMNALRKIYEETRQAIYLYALRKLGNRSLAEDAMQETYLRIAGASASYTPGTNARAWIYGICRNICRDMRKVPETSDIDEMEDLTGEKDFSDSFILSEDVRRAFSHLSAEEREIIELYLYSDFKLGDIAEHLGLPYNTVRSKYTYALKKMKAELGTSYRKEVRQ